MKPEASMSTYEVASASSDYAVDDEEHDAFV